MIASRGRRGRTDLLSSAALLAPLLLSAAAANAAARIGVLPLEHVGAEDPGYGELQATLRQSVGAFSSVPVVDVPPPHGCALSDPHCVARAGTGAAVDLVVFGSVERFSDGYAVRLRTVDVRSLDEHEVKRLVQGGLPDLLGVAELAACQLLVTEKCEGTLKITGLSGARVMVDTREVGVVPYTGSLPVGRHSIRVAHGGRSTDDHFVTISFRQTMHMRLTERGGMLVFEKGEFESLPPPAAVPAPVEAPVPVAESGGHYTPPPHFVATPPPSAPGPSTGDAPLPPIPDFLPPPDAVPAGPASPVVLVPLPPSAVAAVPAPAVAPAPVPMQPAPIATPPPVATVAPVPTQPPPPAASPAVVAPPLQPGPPPAMTQAPAPAMTQAPAPAMTQAPAPSMTQAPAPAQAAAANPPPVTEALPASVLGIGAPPPPKPAARSVDLDHAGLRTAFIVASAAGGGFLLAGLLSGAVALADANAVNTAYNDGRLQNSDQGTYNQAKSAATAANVFYGIGALGAVTAGVLFLVDPRMFNAPARPSVSPVSSPGGEPAQPAAPSLPSLNVSPAGASLSGTF